MNDRYLKFFKFEISEQEEEEEEKLRSQFYVTSRLVFLQYVVLFWYLSMIKSKFILLNPGVTSSTILRLMFF